MYSLVRRASPSSLAWIQAPSFIVSFAIASLFYKLGSFALECIAFLATWFVIDLVISKAREMLGGEGSKNTRS